MCLSVQILKSSIDICLSVVEAFRLLPHFAAVLQVLQLDVHHTWMCSDQVDYHEDHCFFVRLHPCCSTSGVKEDHRGESQLLIKLGNVFEGRQAVGFLD